MHDLAAELPYTPLFCEENIWFLANRLLDEGMQIERMYVLLFSNPAQSIILLQQKAARQMPFIVWDYHVVLQAHHEQTDWIYDFDSRLAFPSPLARYFALTFPEQQCLPGRYHTQIRQIPAMEYLERFYSDRSHMLGKIPQDQFPAYPSITPDPTCRPLTLDDYRDVQRPLDGNSRIFDLEAYMYGWM